MFRSEDFPDLVLGMDARDDAAVWRLDGERSLVVTTDFFTPVVDDAYDFGAIAAANALSDLYAMGADPIFALNLAAMPTDLPADIVGEILRGGAEKVREAGAVIAGGHTIQDREPKYGLVALGLCRTDLLLTKAGAKPGDLLVLTKPLGMGVTTTALKNGLANAQDVQEATAWMKRLNAPAAALARAHGLRAATDITGFGLLGHGWEMAQASGVRLRIFGRSVPILDGARRYAKLGTFPGGSTDNRNYFGSRVSLSPAIPPEQAMLLFDAQTSGGLLLPIPPSVASAFVANALEREIPLWPIGRVEEGQGILVVDESMEKGDGGLTTSEVRP